MTDLSFFEDCLDDEEGADFKRNVDEENRHTFEFAYAMALTRSCDEKFLPLLDMFNHHRGEYECNVHTDLGTSSSRDEDDEENFDTIEVFANKNINDDLDLDLDDATYFNIMKLAFSEMAIVLGDSDKQWLITLPEPNYAVQKTMKRISKILSSVQEDDHPVNHRFKKMISALAVSSRHQVSNKRKDLRVDSTLSVINEGSTASAYY